MKLDRNGLRGVFGALLSAVLLMLSFSPFERNELAWVALVPLWLVCRYASVRRAAFLSWLCGSVFFLTSINWLTNVTVPGFIGLSFYCALYFIPFGMVISWGSRRFGTDRWYFNFLLMFWATASWAGFEYLRGIVFTGFAWNPLAVSQYSNLTVAQLASWGGVAAVSAMVVWMNSAIAVTVVHYLEHRSGWCKRPHFELMAGFMLLALAMAGGWRTMYNGHLAWPEGDPFRVGLIQPAIPHLLGDWPAEHIELIYDRVESLTEMAQHSGGLHMIIWSETVLPDFLRNSRRSLAFTRRFATNGVPVLAGAMDFGWEEDGIHYFNSALLMDETGEIVGKYDKQHLVIFGEYIPMHDQFPWLNTLSPIQSSFTPGKGPVQLSVDETTPPFSVLICFEDTVAPLARQAVNQGARWLINQTNDSWFNDTEAVQHMAQCVFRAIENRVPMVRCANTGVTCAIDPFGRLTSMLRDKEGRIGKPGFLIAEVQPVQEVSTFYRRHGELFGGGCALLSGLGLLVAFFRFNKRG